MLSLDNPPCNTMNNQLQTQDTPFSRERFIAEVTAYYNFLANIYLPASAIKRPPASGWAEVTPEYLSCLHKNETVIDLIRHLPLIERDEYDDPYQIYESTTAVDFTGKFIKNHFNFAPANTMFAEPIQKYDRLPSYVLCFATTPGSRNGNYIFVDTTRDAVILADLQVGPKPTK